MKQISHGFFMSTVFFSGDREFNRKLWSLTLPITLQSLMLALVAAADAVMLGGIDQDAMSSVSLATQIQFVQNVFLWGLSSGAGILGAQYWGKKDMHAMEEIFGLTVRKMTILSFLFFIACLLIPEKLMLLFTHDQVLISCGTGYLRIAGWSYLFVGVSQCYLAIMRVSGHAACSAWISSVTVILNIVFNAVFIFGLCGFPAMGVGGAAVATVLARTIELIWCISTGFMKDFVSLKWRMIRHFNVDMEKDFWKYTLPVNGSSLLWGIGFTAYTAIIGHLGRDAAAANSVAAVVRDLVCCLCNGIAGGCTILIGNELGAGHLEKGKLYGKYSMHLSLICGVVSCVFILLSIPLVSSFVKLSDRACEYMYGMFIILSVYMIGRCICGVLINGIFAAGGDTMFDIYSLAVFMWGIALPCAFFGAFYLGLPVLAVYACTCLDEVGKVPWVFHHYRKYKWVKNITR